MSLGLGLRLNRSFLDIFEAGKDDNLVDLVARGKAVTSGTSQITVIHELFLAPALTETVGDAPITVMIQDLANEGPTVTSGVVDITVKIQDFTNVASTITSGTSDITVADPP